MRETFFFFLFLASFSMPFSVSRKSQIRETGADRARYDPRTEIEGEAGEPGSERGSAMRINRSRRENAFN